MIPAFSWGGNHNKQEFVSSAKQLLINAQDTFTFGSPEQIKQPTKMPYRSMQEPLMVETHLDLNQDRTLSIVVIGCTCLQMAPLVTVQ